MEISVASFLSASIEPVKKPEHIERALGRLNTWGYQIGQIIEHSQSVIQKYSDANEQPFSGDIMEYLAEQGWLFAGAGHFSMVFTNSDGLALKVGLKREDSGAAYAAWCRANQDKAGVPVVYDIERYKHCYLVLMKAYKPFDGYDAPIPLYQQYTDARDAIAGYAPTTTEPSEICKTAQEIRAFFKGVAQFDMHHYNVMVDGDNLVITDPVSYREADGDVVDYMDYTTNNEAIKEHA